MGKKIFVSYKYADNRVQHLDSMPWYETTTARHYVDVLQSKLDEEDHINKGEDDGEDLSDFADETIWSKLREKIYDSSVTIVLISPGMRESWKSEKDQWIPWEISYSLRETTRNDRTSRRNGVLAVVLPDNSGSYDYALEKRTCCNSGCNTWKRDSFFWILRENMFNKKAPTTRNCNRGTTVYTGWFSYIHMVRWEDFISNINYWVGVAESIQDNKDDYNIKVNMPDNI